MPARVSTPCPPAEQRGRALPAGERHGPLRRLHAGACTPGGARARRASDPCRTGNCAWPGPDFPLKLNLFGSTDSPGSANLAQLTPSQDLCNTLEQDICFFDPPWGGLDYVSQVRLEDSSHSGAQP
jgi:hypothetical protein